MSVPLNMLSEPGAPTVCCLLRTKTAFGGYELDDQPANWQSGQSTTAVFWCLRTMGTAGPDEKFAHPDDCRAARRCFSAGE